MLGSPWNTEPVLAAVMDFPWDVAIGLAVVLSGTLAAIIYILLLDHIES